MKPSRLIALAATAGILAAGVAGCSSHKNDTSTTLGATPPTTAVPPGMWQTQDLTALTGAPAAVSGGIAGYLSEADGTQHVLYVSNANAHIEDLWRDAIGWHAHDLTAATGAPAARLNVTGYAFEGAQHAIYLSTSHHIQDLWWDRNGAHVEDLMALTGAPLATDAITGYGFQAQGTQHVIYFSWPDGRIHELWWDANGWHHDDLTAATSAPTGDIGNDPVGYVFDGTQHVFNVGTDHQMHELWWDRTGWHDNNLTAATGAPPSIGGFITAYPFEAQGTQHLIYKSYSRVTHGGPIADALRELWWDRSGWHTDDLTALIGAPSDPWAVSGYAFDAQGTQHVIVDSDHIYELWWDRTGWHKDDLTAITSAPGSGGNGPVGYAFDAQGTQHVVYSGRDDRHIHELWWGRRAPA
jgi:hypothetical protein